MSLFPNWYLVVASAALLILTLAGLLFPGRGHRDGSRTTRKRWRRLGVALALLVVAVRPTVGNVLTTTYASGADVVLMIDRTTSMGATDYDGGKPRMDGVRADVAALVQSLAGCRFAVIVFDNNARVALPFTTDGSAVVSLVDALDWRIAEYGNGSDISIGLDAAQQLLSASQQAHPNLDRYLYYFGDGEQTRPSAPQPFDPLRPLVTGATVLGYGTSQGGRMLTAPGSTQYVSQNGVDSLSRIDEQNLTAMAQQLQGSYLHRTAPGGLTAQVNNPTRIPVVHRDPRGFEIYWIAGLVMAGLLIWELWDDVAYYRRARREWT